MSGADRDRVCGVHGVIPVVSKDTGRMFPRTRFADENTVEQQIDKLRSEVIEAFEETDDSAFLTECGDIVQAFITLLDIAPAFGDYIIKGVIEKNRARGYYDR